MFEFVTENTLEEYERFNASHPYGHFMQSHKWAKVKDSWKWEAVLCRNSDGEIIGSLAVLIRRLPKLPYTIMYGCRGPVCDPHDAKTLAQLIDGAKKLAQKHNSYVLKLDPDVLIEDTEFTRHLMTLGFLPASTGKGFEGIQPNFVFRLNVDGMDEEAAMNHFHSKTRYNIRYAIRKGVTVQVVGKEMLPFFSKIMLETGLRDGFVTRPQSYFEKILDELGENARLYMAFWEGQPIAGTLAIYYGDKVWYLYGASANEFRNVMPNYLLQWHMILWSLEKKCRIYDFRGVSGDISEDNPLYGLYRFKKGFEGDFCQFVGEFDLVFKPCINYVVNHGQRIFRKLRLKLFLKKNKDKDTSKPKNLTGNHNQDSDAKPETDSAESKD